MVTINYQRYGTKGFRLRLRLYQDGETKYINVTKMLKGDIQRKHWNPNKQLFIPSCPFSEENNAIIVRFRQKFDEMAASWTGSLYGMLAAMEGERLELLGEPTLSDFIRSIVEELNKRKHPDGTKKGSFEAYEKCERRLKDFCKAKGIAYEKLYISEITSGFVDDLFAWIKNARKGKGMNYVSPILHSILMKADNAGHLDFEDFKNCTWWKKPRGSVHKFHTLTEEQCEQFAKMDLSKVSRSTLNELYRDFCLFILYTGQSACDAIALRYSNIKNIGGVSYLVFKRRKISEKQAVPCSVPINAELHRIIQKWQYSSKDGYLFPIRNKEKLETQTTNNGDIKHFIGKLNIWLKKVGRAIGCEFPLHTYTFRHTAITHYISKGVPVIYVANMMGTSVDNCEKVYYNNHGDTTSRNKVMMAMRF